MSSKIGLIGKPNAGKSTLFSAITATSVEIADYPFTTLSPNIGTSFIIRDCPEPLIGKKCSPNHGSCADGKRYIPVQIVDVPGLIEGASQGKGMGNQFLQSLIDAEALIHVFDGFSIFSSDNPKAALKREIEDIWNEVIAWAADLISRDWERFSKKADASGERLEKQLSRKVSSLGIGEGDLRHLLSKTSLPQKLSLWGKDDFDAFSKSLFTFLKPIVNVANKCDLLSDNQLGLIGDSEFKCKLVSAEYELALQKALDHGMIGSRMPPFDRRENLNTQQASALNRIEEFLRKPSISRPFEILDEIVEHVLNLIVVYPVYDESSWTDKNGNVLPDAFMMSKGSTPVDLAYRVHTDIGEGFIRAVDCKTRMVIGRDHELRDGDVIRIVSKS